MGSEIVVGGYNVHCSCCTEHGRYGLSSLYAETVECSEQCWVCTVCWSLSYVVKFIAAEHDRYGLMEDCGVTKAEYLVL